MRKLLSRHSISTIFCVILSTFLLSSPSFAAEKTKFKIAWSIYVGWMPWDYANQHGILKKWADKYGIEIQLTQINDYIESINQYTAGQFDACVMTNMDALTIPAAGGVDSTALIVGDFSNGNDGVVLKGKNKTLKDIKGQKINLVELSVSHYLLARGLGTIGLKERDISVVNTSDADIVSAFATQDVTSVVAWNPQLSEIKAAKDAALVFDSSKIPGEIMDLMVTKTDVLKAHPELGKALVGAWYEAISVMAMNDDSGKKSREFMAKASGTDLAGFESQLKTTYMYYKPAESVTFSKSQDIVKTMDQVRHFSFDHGLLGQGAKSVDAVGVAFPSGETLGDKNNIKLRFNAEFMQMAADEKL